MKYATFATEVDPRDFTSDHETLLNILRTNLQGGGPTALWNAINVGITALLHQLDVRVTGEGRTVRARKRYLARKDAAG